MLGIRCVYRAEVAAQIDGRSSKQCRERWNNSLNPDLKKTPFTTEEDQILMDGWKNCGPRWNMIAKHLPGRTQTKIRDRFKTLRIRHKDEVEDWERRMLQNRKESSASDSENCAQNVPPPMDVDELKAEQQEREAKKVEIFAIKRVGSLDCLLVDESEDQSESSQTSVSVEEVALGNTFDLQGGDTWTPTYGDGGIDFDSMMPSMW